VITIVEAGTTVESCERNNYIIKITRCWMK